MRRAVQKRGLARQEYKTWTLECGELKSKARLSRQPKFSSR